MACESSGYRSSKGDSQEAQPCQLGQAVVITRGWLPDWHSSWPSQSALLLIRCGIIWKRLWSFSIWLFYIFVCLYSWPQITCIIPQTKWRERSSLHCLASPSDAQGLHRRPLRQYWVTRNIQGQGTESGWGKEGVMLSLICLEFFWSLLDSGSVSLVI